MVRIAILSLVLALFTACGNHSQSGPLEGDPQPKDDRTAFAVGIARDYASAQDATLSWATAEWSQGTVAQPNTDNSCDSGQLVRISLVGSFPMIVTSGGPPGGDETSGDVKEVVLTADAESGKICHISVTSGDVQRIEGATELPLV